MSPSGVCWPGQATSSVFGHDRHPRTANGPVQRHPAGHRAQPSGKAARIAELTDLPHGLDEHLLADLLRLGVIAEPAEGNRVDRPLKLLEQPAEGLPVALLGGGDEPGLDRLGIFVLEFKGLHAHSPKEKLCRLSSGPCHGETGKGRGKASRGRGMRKSKPQAARRAAARPGNQQAESKLDSGLTLAVESPGARLGSPGGLRAATGWTPRRTQYSRGIREYSRHIRERRRELSAQPFQKPPRLVSCLT